MVQALYERRVRSGLPRDSAIRFHFDTVMNLGEIPNIFATYFI